MITAAQLTSTQLYLKEMKLISPLRFTDFPGGGIEIECSKIYTWYHISTNQMKSNINHTEFIIYSRRANQSY